MKTEAQIHARAKELLRERTVLQRRIRSIELLVLECDCQLAALRMRKERAA